MTIVTVIPSLADQNLDMKLLSSLLLLLFLTVNGTAEPLPESPEKAADPYKGLIKGKWMHQEEPVSEGGLPFWFYADRKLSRAKSGKKYPLIIVLHGRRDKAKEGDPFKVQNIATVWTKDEVYKKNASFVVQPYYPPKGGWEKIPEQIDAFISDIAKHLPVDLKRIYLVGFSNGGQGTFQTLARQPDWFAGAITMAGPVSPKSVVGKIKVPIWCFVGADDTSLNKNVRLPALAKELQKSDDRVKLTVVPNAGHGVFPQSLGLEEVRNWLFEQTL